MESVRKFCNRAILLEDGKIVLDGEPDKVASAYNKMLGIVEKTK
jgi:ABC-type polysaccharide/polyol phosphate transport system ATPase subunit